MRTFVIADGRLPEEQVLKLTELGFTPVLLPPSPRLGSAVASHADMLMLFDGDVLITEREYYRSNSGLIDDIISHSGAELILSDAAFESEYPKDAIFNACLAHDKIFVKSDSIAQEILSYARARGLKVVSTKQGYPACTALILSKNLAITSDIGMAKSLEKEGILTTIIDNTSKILLPPHEYGFIGGCAGIYRDTVYFTGDINAHPDSKKIKATISDAGLKCVSLACGELLLDVGGLRFFDEAIDDDRKQG